MTINEFKKLEKKINGYTFNQSYKSINTIMTILSYFGHVVSIFLAYFFMSKVISSATENPIAIFIASIILLSGLELLKRDIFDKFSILSLKEKTINKTVLPLFFLSTMLILASFYSTINGAKEFSSKADKIENIKEETITTYSDSITSIYQPKIADVENEIKNYKSLISIKDEEQSKIATSLQERGYLTKSEKERNTQLSQEKKELDDKVTKSEIKTTQIKSERDSIIQEYQNKITQKSNSQKEDNNKSSFLFVILSTIIELIILGGVYFNEYYKFRSYKEFRNKIEKDPNYQKWLLYDDILSIIISDDTKLNEKLPSNKNIVDMCKLNDIIVLPKDITNLLKVLNILGIIKTSGSVRYICKTKESSKESLKKHFNIN